jgi:hypothetical protein
VEGIIFFTTYFPASPVQNATQVGGNTSNGGAESWIELSKALNYLGDSRLSTGCNVLKWAVPPYSSARFNFQAGLPYNVLPELDYRDSVVRWDNGSLQAIQVEIGNVGADNNSFAGNIGSSCFAMAIDLETSNGGEISGLNAEEQSDISLIARWNVPQAAGFVFDVYTYIDSMIVLRENNVILFYLLLGFGTNSINIFKSKLYVYNFMAALSDTFEYFELACSNYDATVPGGQLWKGSTSPLNEIVYSWPKFYWNEKSPDIVGMKVLEMSFQNVWDTVNTINNSFIYTINGVPTTVTIPTGFYTGATMAAALQTALSSITAGFTVTVNATLQVFVFTQTISALPWSFTFPNKQTLYFHMGFIPNSTVAAAGVGSSFISPLVANPDGPRYLYLNSRIMGPLINFNLTDGNVGSAGGPQIAKIPITGVKNGYFSYTDTNPTMFFDFFVGTKFETFDLYLTLGSDQDQTPLDMKGSEWSVKLGFICYRDATRNIEKKPTKRGSQMISS